MNVSSGFEWAGRAGRAGQTDADAGAGAGASVGEVECWRSGVGVVGVVDVGGDDDADESALAAAAPAAPDEACGGSVGECGYEMTTT